MIRSYRDLEVWQKAMDFVVGCYRACDRYPKTELYGRCSQTQRAAVSVPANIAEGHGRDSSKEYLHHLSISYASLLEAETHLQIAERLAYLDAESLRLLLAQSAEIGRMLNGLAAAIRLKISATPCPPPP